jgi:hypothetical protein
VRRARSLAPPVPGSLAALVVGSALVLAAAVVPSVAPLPAWLAAEVVLAVWWVIWSLALAALLEKGWRISDDGRAPARPLPDQGQPPGLGWLDVGWAPDDGAGFAIVVGLALVYVAGWAAVDLVFPLVLLGGYVAIVSALARVAHDRHGCEGRPLRALGWGALWATIYTLPLATFVLMVHVGHR